MYTAETSSTNPLRGAAAGIIGGIAGSAVMVAFNHLLAQTGFGTSDTGRHHQARRVDAKPNDSDGTTPDEPASRKGASRAAAMFTGRWLTEQEKDTAGLLAHYTFGAAVGSVYGAIAARVPKITQGAGLPYGAAVFVTATEMALPLTGLARKPTEYPPARHVAALASHLVYGMTLEAMRRVLMRRSRARDRYEFPTFV